VHGVVPLTEGQQSSAPWRVARNATQRSAAPPVPGNAEPPSRSGAEANLSGCSGRRAGGQPERAAGPGQAGQAPPPLPPPLRRHSDANSGDLRSNVVHPLAAPGAITTA